MAGRRRPGQCHTPPVWAYLRGKSLATLPLTTVSAGGVWPAMLAASVPARGFVEIVIAGRSVRIGVTAPRPEVP